MTKVETGTNALPEVIIYTDGACKGNPGPGGWGCILYHPATGTKKEFSGGAPVATNNQMEMQAVIQGLLKLKSRSKVTVVTDSSYVQKGCMEWLPGWKKKGWKRMEKGVLKPLKNVELWQQLDELLTKHTITITWIKGHAGHKENERCDELAVIEAAKFA